MTTIDQDGELDLRRPPGRDHRIDGGANSSPVEEHVIDEQHRPAVDGGRWQDWKRRRGRPRQIVAVRPDVKR